MELPVLQELPEKEMLQKRWSSRTPFAVYLYTPWCGTCKFGEKMLRIVHALEPSAELYRSNIHFLPTIVQEWKIESVPCLAIIENKKIKEKIYAMRSVDFLLAKVREHLT